RHLWAIYVRGKARRWNLGRAAAPIRLEADVLIAFAVESGQAGRIFWLFEGILWPLRSRNAENSVAQQRSSSLRVKRIDIPRHYFRRKAKNNRKIRPHLMTLCRAVDCSLWLVDG